MAVLFALNAAIAAPPGTFSLRLCVDQFGYLPDQVKVAVISDPKVGFNAAASYTPGSLLEVRTWGEDTVVFTGAPVAWSDGATNAQSGDRAWWFDFSSVTRSGDYYVYDPANDARSARFQIRPDVYEAVLQQAVRVFYYQRRGIAKTVPYADPRWTDGVSFMGANQDTQCRLVTNPTAATQRDLRGGWFDAGDYNKYVNWTATTLNDLLFAYRQNPLIWPDDWGIPESGNGVPDLLDEVKWQLDWLLRMQAADGSVLSKMGVTNWNSASPPSAERSVIRYGAASTTATLTTAGNFALAAPIYLSVGLTNYAQTLSNAAVRAYDWAIANPNVVFNNTGFASQNPEVGNFNYDRDSLRLRAAIYLYALTGQPAYRTYAESTYASRNAIGWTWWGPYQSAVQDAMLQLTTLPGVSASVINTIRNSKQNSINGADFMGAWNSSRDPYRAFITDATYHWGSNQQKCRIGALFAQQLVYDLNPAQAAGYRAAAGGFLHYLHGVNPWTLVYLSNMYEHGAERSANEMYHSWFAHGTIWDNALTSPRGPAPGYLTGGPNRNFAPDPAYNGPPLVPPQNQPMMKAYRDWNTSWPENSWEITEPAIYYQSAYVYLLSRFVQPLTYAAWAAGHGLTGAATNILADTDGDGVPHGTEFAFNLSPLVDDRDGLPRFELRAHQINGANATCLTVEFPRQLGQPNLTYRLEGSDDLRTWTTLCSASGAHPPTGPGFISETGTAYLRTVLARDLVPVEQAASARFVRLLVIWD